MLRERHHVLGKQWVEISSKYFKGTRSENYIKNQWYNASFKKCIAKEFGPDAYRVRKDTLSSGKKATVVLPAGNYHHRRPVMVNGDMKYVNAPPIISGSEVNMTSSV